MKRIITPGFEIISEPVDSDHEDNWPTLLHALAKALAIYDEAELNRRRRLRRPKSKNASTTTATPLKTLTAKNASTKPATPLKKLTALFRT